LRIEYKSMQYITRVILSVLRQPLVD